MSAVLLDGKALAKQVRQSVAADSQTVAKKLGRKPKLAVILVGDNPASKVYVASKTKHAMNCGMEVRDVSLPASVDDQELQDKIREINEDLSIDGILLQLPLPGQLDELGALLCINPRIDADGLHPINQGLLLRGEAGLRPCTPLGCMKLVEHAREKMNLSRDLSGLHAVVVGRSILVGKPMGLLLLERNCTVSYCHSKTDDLAAVCRTADILVAAVGRPQMLNAQHVKPGSIVIDVGINRTEEGGLVGDVDFSSVQEIAGAITPVPGGVGPMTIAMLLRNTVDTALCKIGYGDLSDG